jgi:endonuclease/exonuclease/phosphatase family metal-dependent hydrolase
MAPILFKRSAFRLVDRGCFWLSETPNVPASISWGAAFPRTATWAQLVHLASGRHLTFLNTHFDYTLSALENSARVIQAWVKKEGETHPLLVTGDFNADKESSTYQLLTTGSSLFDIHPAGEGTFHGYGQTNDPIDWMLASDSFQAVSSQIDRFHAENVYPSDHYPVTATLEWK